MKRVTKIAKGYRLRPETHKMIREIQKYVRGSLDDSINLACRRLLKEIKEINIQNYNTAKLNIFIKQKNNPN